MEDFLIMEFYMIFQEHIEISFLAFFSHIFSQYFF